MYNCHSLKDHKLVFNTTYRLMQVKSVAECILQCFRPSLSYHVSLSSLFCLFLKWPFYTCLTIQLCSGNQVAWVYFWEVAKISKNVLGVLDINLHKV